MFDEFFDEIPPSVLEPSFKTSNNRIQRRDLPLSIQPQGQNEDEVKSNHQTTKNKIFEKHSRKKILQKKRREKESRYCQTIYVEDKEDDESSIRRMLHSQITYQKQKKFSSLLKFKNHGYFKSHTINHDAQKLKKQREKFYENAVLQKVSSSMNSLRKKIDLLNKLTNKKMKLEASVQNKKGLEKFQTVKKYLNYFESKKGKSPTIVEVSYEEPYSHQMENSQKKHLRRYSMKKDKPISEPLNLSLSITRYQQQ